MTKQQAKPMSKDADIKHQHQQEQESSTLSTHLWQMLCWIWVKSRQQVAKLIAVHSLIQQ